MKFDKKATKKTHTHKQWERDEEPRTTKAVIERFLHVKCDFLPLFLLVLSFSNWHVSHSWPQVPPPPPKYMQKPSLRRENRKLVCTLLLSQIYGKIDLQCQSCGCIHRNKNQLVYVCWVYNWWDCRQWQYFFFLRAYIFFEIHYFVYKQCNALESNKTTDSMR